MGRGGRLEKPVEAHRLVLATIESLTFFESPPICITPWVFALRSDNATQNKVGDILSPWKSPRGGDPSRAGLTPESGTKDLDDLDSGTQGTPPDRITGYLFHPHPT